MRVYIALFFSLVCLNLQSQQRPDLSYDPEIINAAYARGKGSIILMDEGHNNFHTRNGRYAPFAKVLEKDGYRIEVNKGQFNEESLTKGKILVIANALNKVNVDNWSLPTPSAFTKEEIEAIEHWVYKGGNLFLIADHMPWPGAAEELAKVFGFKFYNGFNIDIINPAFFWRSNGTIANNSITSGRDSSEMIHQIPRTEGQAFEIPEDAEPILIFDKSSFQLMPDTAWVFNESTPLIPANGMVQGAFKQYGNGRIVVFGEASLFSAQIGEPGNRKMGMNSESGKDNYRLLLNIIHWLDGILD